MATTGVSPAQTAPEVQRDAAFWRIPTVPCAIPSTRPAPARSQSPRPSAHCMKAIRVETLEEALVEGIVTGHPSMPQFTFDPDQASNLIA